jgi:hypothetical protein
MNTDLVPASKNPIDREGLGEIVKVMLESGNACTWITMMLKWRYKVHDITDYQVRDWVHRNPEMTAPARLPAKVLEQVASERRLVDTLSETTWLAQLQWLRVERLLNLEIEAKVTAPETSEEMDRLAGYLGRIAALQERLGVVPPANYAEQAGAQQAPQPRTGIPAQLVVDRLVGMGVPVSEAHSFMLGLAVAQMASQDGRPVPREIQVNQVGEPDQAGEEPSGEAT